MIIGTAIITVVVTALRVYACFCRYTSCSHIRYHFCLQLAYSVHSSSLCLHLSICLSVCLSVCLPIYLSVSIHHPSIHPSIHPSTYLPFCLSASLLIYPSTYRSIYLSIYLLESRASGYVIKLTSLEGIRGLQQPLSIQ